MIEIKLLGPPAVTRDGEPARPPRGLKSWALLAYLLLAERPPGRRQLAELLFGDADDPLGALRWSLAELRRTFDLPQAFRGDPVIADLGDGVTVDIDLLSEESPDPPALLAITGELLEGVQLTSCLEFESWLLVARHRSSATAEALLHSAATERLADGHPALAVELASRVVALNPLDEANHELLVRSLAEAGDQAAALKQVAVCEDLLRRELGIEASRAVRDAAETRTGSPRSLELSGRAAAASQLEAGRAAIAAGAIDAGLQCIRIAVAEAARSKDTGLHARSLTVLGSALVHAARGRDEEGSVALHEAILLGLRADDPATVATAYRQLGFIDVQAGRRTTADTWLTKAHEYAQTDEERAAVLGVRGMNASDRGDYPQAFAYLTESVELAAAAGDERQRAWSMSIIGRAHLLRDERPQAADAIAATIDIVQQQRWIAFLPWPQALRGELTLYSGDESAASDELEQAWTLACQIGDPCWEGMAARGLGQLHANQGDHGRATTWFSEAATRCTRFSDRYQWVHAYVLDAAITNAIDYDDTEQATPLVERLALLAARSDMREFVVRSYLHRSRLGDTSGLLAARHLSDDIDNPALTAMVDAAAPAR